MHLYSKLKPVDQSLLNYVGPQTMQSTKQIKPTEITILTSTFFQVCKDL